MWLCGYVAKGLHWGNRRKVVGEPPARKTLTDLSSGLLEPQGKPGWGKSNCPHGVNSHVWGARGAMGELNSPPWWLVHCLASCDPGVTRTRWSASLHAAWLLGQGLFLVTLFAGASFGQGSLPTSSPSPFLFRRFRGKLHSVSQWSGFRSLTRLCRAFARWCV